LHLLQKLKKKNLNPDPNKSCLYVGYSSKPPRERWNQHLSRARNKEGTGRVFSPVAAEWGENYIHWKKYNKYNPINGTEEKAKRLEKKIAIKYRDKGHAVWSDALPYVKKPTKSRVCLKTYLIH